MNDRLPQHAEVRTLSGVVGGAADAAAASDSDCGDRGGGADDTPTDRRLLRRRSGRVHRSTASTRHAPPSLWHDRDFVLLFVGQFISLTGRASADVTLPLLAFALSHSIVVLGITGVLRWLPYLVVGLLAGVLADRVNRRAIMLVGDILRTALFASIPLAALIGGLPLALVLIVAGAEALIFVFFDAAELAAIPQFAETPEQISTAYSALGVATNMSQLVGPLGTALYGIAPSLPFVGTAASLGCSVVSLAKLRTSLSTTSVYTLDEVTRPPLSLWSTLREGLIWLWQHPTLRAIACLSGLGNMVVVAYPYILIFDATLLHLSPLWTGIVLSVSALGGAVGALLATPLMRWVGFAPVFIAASLLQALLWPTILLAHTGPLLALVAAGSSWIDQIVSLAQQGYRGQMIDEQVMGRVQAIFRMLLNAGMPLGFVLFGLVLAAWGFAPLIWGGTLTLLLLGILTWCMPAIRHAPTAATLHRQPVSAEAALLAAARHTEIGWSVPRWVMSHPGSATGMDAFFLARRRVRVPLMVQTQTIPRVASTAATAASADPIITRAGDADAPAPQPRTTVSTSIPTTATPSQVASHRQQECEEEHV